MDIIKYNPYRVLGVYSNAPKKEIIGAENKIRAHVKVGKQISFKSDFSSLLGEIKRTEESLANAVSNLTVAKDKIRYALFWFINENAFDEVAFNHLAVGNIDNTIDILRKKAIASSFINLAVCSLIKRQWANSLYYYSRLIDDNVYKEFVSKVAGEETVLSNKEISIIIIDTLELFYPEVNWLFFSKVKTLCLGSETINLGNALCDSILAKELKSRYIDKICEKIGHQIEESDKLNRKGPSDCLSSARILSGLSSDFKTLCLLIGKTDIRYISLSDKVAELLNKFCIGYYNNSFDARRARVVFPFVKDALSFACSDGVTKTCQEGYNFIAKENELLPSEIIETECFEIENHLSNYEERNDRSSLLSCIDSCYHILTIVKNKVGSDDKEYIKRSSQVVHFAINQIVEEVNNKQKAYNEAPQYNDDIEHNAFRECLNWARPIMEHLVVFAKDKECQERFDKNRSTLASLFLNHCHERSGVGYSKPSSSVPRSTSTQRPTYSSQSPNKSKTEDNSGCVWGIIIAIVTIVFLFFVINSNESSSSTSKSNNYSSSSTDYSTSRGNNKRSADSNNRKSPIEPVKTQDDLWLEQYKGNSLKTGATPYKSLYGGNSQSGNSSLQVKAPAICDVLVIVKRGGSVLKHAYIKANQTYVFNLWEGTYQPFFIFGNSWCPEKDAPNGLKGYFLEDVSISKDYPQEIGEYQQLEYTLQAVRNGNFHAASSNVQEAF